MHTSFFFLIYLGFDFEVYVNISINIIFSYIDLSLHKYCFNLVHR